MTVWHHERNDNGDVVELHGNVKHLVCPSCEHVAEARPGDLALMKKCLPRMCPSCHKAQLRFKIMLYDDHESDKITPENVYERLEEDCAIADLIIWVGISFEQVC
jgi:NAD-dependent SIR2 family protein deacetylase